MPEWLDGWFAMSGMNGATWLGCSLTLMLGAFVQRATGFGLAVVGAPLLLMLEPRLVPAILVLFGFLVSLLMVRHYWREVRLDAIGMALVGKLPGTVLGVWLLLVAPLALLEQAIALIVLSAVAISLLRFSLPLNRISLFVAGLLSGVFGSISAIGGPPVVLVMQRLSPDAVRGNLAAFFAISSVMTLIALTLAGRLESWHLAMALTFLPSIVLGNALAKRVAPRLKRRALQNGSLVLCTLAALALLL